MTEIRLESKDLDHTMAALNWCVDNCKDTDYQYISAWPAQYIDFQFKNTKDALLFKLQWSR